jgi:DNA-binding CsgD family transcriptional regulator
LILQTDANGDTVASTTGERGACCDLVNAVDPEGAPICSQTCASEGTHLDRRAAFARGIPVHVTCQSFDTGQRTVIVQPLPLAPEGVQPLSRRECQVLRLAAEGYTDAEIGRLLEISSGTVRTHVRHAREKMSARSRTEAVARALMLNLLHEAGPG